MSLRVAVVAVCGCVSMTLIVCLVLRDVRWLLVVFLWLRLRVVLFCEFGCLYLVGWVLWFVFGFGCWVGLGGFVCFVCLLG